MIIAIDLDETLGDTLGVFLKWYNSKNNSSFSRDQFSSYNFTETLKIPKDDLYPLWHEFFRSKEFETIPPVDGVIEAIEILNEKHELILITARYDLFVPQTTKWIEKHFPKKFKKVFHTTSFDGKKFNFVFKSQICISEGAKVIIEDNGENALECAQKGIKVYLLDYSWNREAKHKNIIRVKNWKEVLKKLV